MKTMGYGDHAGLILENSAQGDAMFRSLVDQAIDF
jgi:hypothetical protein